MALMIVLSTIVFFLFGYYIMGKVDRFIDKNIRINNNYFYDKKLNRMEGIKNDSKS